MVKPVASSIPDSLTVPHLFRIAPATSFAILSAILAVPIIAMLVLGLGFGGMADAGHARAGLWPCLFTASVAAFLSAWIWSLRAHDRAALLFCVSGACTYAFCMGAAVFSLPLELSEGAISIAIAVNVLGASGFGLAMIILFTRYPVVLPRAAAIAYLASGIFGIWTLLALFGDLNVLIEIHRITLAEMIVILILAAAQIRNSKSDPVARAIAVWLGAAVTVGAGSFIALVALPNAVLQAPVIPEEFGFLFFTIIYVALAVAMLRYRIFGLGRWAFQLLFLVGAAIAVLAIDAAIIVAFAIDATQAAGIALILIALCYLPVRAWLWERLAMPAARNRKLNLNEAAMVALAPTAAERKAAWQDLFSKTFMPLTIELSSQPIAKAIIQEDGRKLIAGAPPGFPHLQLSDPDRGRSLFTPDDAALADELAALVSQLEEARTAYDRGAAFERSRIARDIHDNIGAQLLTALHAPADSRKNELIRGTISDLRDVIRDNEGEPLGLEALLADLRAETADRVEVAGVAMDWVATKLPANVANRETVKALRALLREAVSNILRHAHATHISIRISTAGNSLALKIADNGTGFEVGTKVRGHGLANMRQRIETLSGSFEISSDVSGTRIEVLLPL